METKKVTTKTTATKAAAAKRTTARKACARKSSEVAINAQNIGFKAGDVDTGRSVIVKEFETPWFR